MSPSVFQKKNAFITPAIIVDVYAGMRSRSWCYDLYQKIRIANNLKGKHQIPTVKHFCEYVEMQPCELEEILIANQKANRH